MERQRNYYSNYYSSRNNRAQAQNRNPQAQTSTTQAQTSTVTTSAPVTESAPDVIEFVGEEEVEESSSPQIIRINNAATQTSTNTASTTASSATTTNASNSSNRSPSFLLTPLQDYIRTIGAFITYSHAGRTPLLLNGGNNNSTAPTATNNNNNNNGNANNVNFDIEPFNFDAFFGLPDSYFNDGLTKQEINRHTISYEYKPALPVKRKRVKTEESDAITTSAATCTNDNCSICLDKFNPNVQVRRLPCLHVFHIKCIDKWLKRNKKCPICRISITINYDTLMSSLESGSTIDQCLTQQESSRRPLLGPQFGPTITVSLQSNRGNSEITVSGNIVHATVEINSGPSATSPSSSSAESN